MRLLQREPETPSLKTWLSRDVPREAELKQETLARLGHEQAVDALLRIYEREETVREKWRLARLRGVAALGVAFLANLIVGAPWFHLMAFAYWQIVQIFLFGLAAIFNVTALIWPIHKRSRRQNNTITALFGYADNPRVGDALCRALSTYKPADANDQWILHRHIRQILPCLSNTEMALSKDARFNLRTYLTAMETAGAADITPKQEADRIFYADFQIAVLRHFARTQDKNAVPAIRKLAQAKTYSDDGVRVRDAAKSALHSLLRSEP